MKQTTFADVRVDGRCEIRKYNSEQASTIGSSTCIVIECPFCNANVLAYVRSLCGGGKRCTGAECGAIFGSVGNAYKLNG